MSGNRVTSPYNHIEVDSTGGTNNWATITTGVADAAFIVQHA